MALVNDSFLARKSPKVTAGLMCPPKNLTTKCPSRAGLEEKDQSVQGQWLDLCASMAHLQYN